MRDFGRVGVVFFIALVAASVFFASDTSADQISSPDYIINGNLGGNFGGQTTSTDYAMSAIGGEAIVGNGSSGSYIIDQNQGSASTPSMQITIQPSGLVAYYPLDENTGSTTVDASSKGHNGTLSSPAAWTTGKIGSAVNINGPIDASGTGAVLVADNSDLPSGSAMTAEAWAQPSTWASSEAIASQWNYQTSGSWAIQTGSDHNLRVYIAASPTDAMTNYVETDVGSWSSAAGVWHHVAMTFDGTQPAASRVKVYIDGVSVNVTVHGTIPSSLQNSTGNFSIGSLPGLGHAFSGAIDQVKLFNRALSSADINAEYSAQNSGVPTGFSFGAQAGSSVTSLIDTTVWTNASSYGVSVQQNHNLQSGTNTIPAISGTIASPSAWQEGTTTGLGFSLIAAPSLDGKWGSGANYAAFPTSATTFYSGSGNPGATPVVINMSLRLYAPSSQVSGSYSNNVTYTGTTLP